MIERPEGVRLQIDEKINLQEIKVTLCFGVAGHAKQTRFRTASVDSEKSVYSVSSACSSASLTDFCRSVMQINRPH